jgi:hypothetical protein
MELKDLISLVDEAIEKMGVNPADARNEAEGQWFLMNEEMPIYLDAWTVPESNPWNYFKHKEDQTIFQVTIPFCYVPTLKRNEFLEELLTVNLNLQYGGFSMNPNENIIVLSYRKPGSALRWQDVREVIDALGYYAEMVYHVLKDEFNLKRVLISEDSERGQA